MNCLQTESVGCNEHNVSEEKKNTSEYDIEYIHCLPTELRKLHSSEVSYSIASVFCCFGHRVRSFTLSEQLYNELESNWVDSLDLPTQNFVLVGAFSRKAHRARKQVFLNKIRRHAYRQNIPSVRTVTNAHAYWIRFLRYQWYTWL